MGKEPIKTTKSKSDDFKKDFESFRDGAKGDFEAFRKKASDRFKAFTEGTEGDFREEAKTDSVAARQTVEVQERMATARDSVNAQYADAVRDSSNWKAAKLMPAVPAPTKDKPVRVQPAVKAPTTGEYSPEYDAAIRGGASQTADSTVRTTENGLKYSIKDDGRLEYSGSTRDMQRCEQLRPREYYVEANKQYVIGPVKSGIYDVGNMTASTRLRAVVAEHEVCNDIQKRQANGEQITPVEVALMQKHEKDLAAWGLSVVNNKLVQTNPKGYHVSYTTVKDEAALAKQIEKDKKEAAKEAKRNSAVLAQQTTR